MIVAGAARVTPSSQLTGRRILQMRDLCGRGIIMRTRAGTEQDALDAITTPRSAKYTRANTDQPSRC